MVSQAEIVLRVRVKFVNFMTIKKYRVCLQLAYDLASLILHATELSLLVSLSSKKARLVKIISGKH